MEADIRTKKFGIGEILKTGWQIYFDKFSTIVLVCLCVYLPQEIIRALIPVERFADPNSSPGMQMAQNIDKVLEFFIGSLAVIALAWIVEKTFQGEDLSWKDALLHGIARWLPMLGTGLMAGIILAIFTLLLIIPGIIWGIFYTFWSYTVALRHLSGKDALDYSKTLVKGQWWRVFGIQILLTLLGFGVGILIGLPFSKLPDYPMIDILSNFIIDIAGAFFTVTTIVWFLNIEFLKKPAPIMDTQNTQGLSQET